MKINWKMPPQLLYPLSPRSGISSVPVRAAFVSVVLGICLCLTTFGVQAAGVNFIEVQTEGAGNTVDGLAGVSSLAVSPDGNFVYGAGTSDNGIAVFSRDPAAGRLTFVEVQKETDPPGTITGLIQPVQLVVSPDGRWLFVASLTGGVGYTDDAVVAIFSRDMVTGKLTFQHSVSSPDLASAQAITVSPDGAFVYVAGADTNGIPKLVEFALDANTSGVLSQKAVYTEGTAGIEGLAKALDVIISPDNAYLYVSGAGDNAIAVFSRDSSTGALTFFSAVKNGQNGVTGLKYPTHMTMDKDGGYLYAAAPDSLSNGQGSLVVFQRDSGSGNLTFIQSLKDGQQDDVGSTVSGLNGVYSIAMSPEGSQVYAGSDVDNALTIFRRDPGTGRLAYAGELVNAQNGADGLAEPLDIAVSPDGNNLYSAAYIDNKVGVFGIASADLSVVMTADAVTVNTGQQVHYSIVATNNGPDDADNAIITDALTSDLSYVSDATSQGTCSHSAGILICNVGTILAGATATVTLPATVISGNPVINAVQVGSDARDPRPDDNQDSLALAVNTPPTAADDGAVTNIGTAVTIAVLANDQDSDGDALTVSAYDATSTRGGTIVLNSDNTLTYTPPVGYAGNDSFHYTVSDGHGGTVGAVVTILVNSPPVAEDDSVTTTVDTPIIIYVLVNDHDADGNPFSITAVTTPSEKGGTVQANNDGTVTYTPPSGFTGVDTFSYTITDSNDGSGTATVTVQVQQGKTASTAGGSTTTSNIEGGTTTGGGAISWQCLAIMAAFMVMIRITRRVP